MKNVGDKCKELKVSGSEKKRIKEEREKHMPGEQ